MYFVVDKKLLQAGHGILELDSFSPDNIIYKAIPNPFHSILKYIARCWEALEVNKKLITEEQKDYQKELMSNFKLFCDKLEPMVSTKKRHKRSRYA